MESSHKRKHLFRFILTALALAGALVLSYSCQNDPIALEEAPGAGSEVVYAVSIPAGFAEGTPGTRAVSPNGSGGLDATFTTTDDISVYNVTKGALAQDKEYNLKLLHPDADGATAKLVGELTFYDRPNYVTVDVGDVLLLFNNVDGTIDYSSDNSGGLQSGTLSCLNIFDFAWCEVSITGISGTGTVGDPYTLTTSKADFVNAQSMFKFTFTGLPSGVGVKKVTIHSAGDKLIIFYDPWDDTNSRGDITIDFDSSIYDGHDGYDGIANARREANGAGVVYAALRFAPLGENETDDITFTVTGTDDKTYIATKISPVGGIPEQQVLHIGDNTASCHWGGRVIG